MIEKITRAGPSLKELEDLSPMNFEPDRRHTEQAIDLLFPEDPWLCGGYIVQRALTRKREWWRSKKILSTMQFIVPNPMLGHASRKEDGKLSPRCLNNTGPRRFLVVEFDSGSFDAHAASLWHLGSTKALSLTMVVFSGSKSLHGWFHCEGIPEERLLRFMRYAVQLGADPATWTRCQFVRMPDGRRPVGNDRYELQQILYFDPDVVDRQLIPGCVESTEFSEDIFVNP